MSNRFIRKYITISTSVPLKITTDRTNQVIELLPGFYQFENEKDERYTFSPDIGEEVKVSDTDVFFSEGVRSVDGELDALDADLEMMAGAMEAMGDSIDALSANDTALDARLIAVESGGTSEARLDAIESDEWVTEQRIANGSVSNEKLGNESISREKIGNSQIVRRHLASADWVPTSASIANGAITVVDGPSSLLMLLNVSFDTTSDWRLLSVYKSGGNWKARILNNSGTTGSCIVRFTYMLEQ